MVKEYVLKKLDQNQAPIYEALVKLRKKRIVPFDVPGHKRGRGNPELVELLGEKCVGIEPCNEGSTGLLSKNNRNH